MRHKEAKVMTVVVEVTMSSLRALALALALHLSNRLRSSVLLRYFRTGFDREEIVLRQTHFGSQRHINTVTQRNVVISCRLVVDCGF